MPCRLHHLQTWAHAAGQCVQPSKLCSPSSNMPLLCRAPKGAYTPSSSKAAMLPPPDENARASHQALVGGDQGPLEWRGLAGASNAEGMLVACSRLDLSATWTGEATMFQALVLKALLQPGHWAAAWTSPPPKQVIGRLRRGWGSGFRV